MSQIVKHNGVAHLSGQIAMSRQGDVKEQTQEILSQIDDLLAAGGSDKDRILSATIWLKSMDDFNSFNEVWDAWVNPETAPARACVQANLAFPELLVEISIVCAASD